MADPQTEVWIDYTNHRGERAWRHILPLAISFQNSQWHPESQWIMEAVDCDRSVTRDFALASIHEWRTSPPEVTMAKSKGTKSSGSTNPRPKPSTTSGGNKLKPASLGTNDRGTKGGQSSGTSRGC